MIGELKNKDAELCVDEVNVYYVECAEPRYICQNDCIGGTGCFITCDN